MHSEVLSKEKKKKYQNFLGPPSFYGGNKFIKKPMITIVPVSLLQRNRN